MQCVKHNWLGLIGPCPECVYPAPKNEEYCEHGVHLSRPCWKCPTPTVADKPIDVEWCQEHQCVINAALGCPYCHVMFAQQNDTFNFDGHETILDEAKRLVYGDRNADYGHPADNVRLTGQMMGVVLHEWLCEVSGRSRNGEPVSVPPELVTLVMIAVKLAREVHKPKRDNLVDIAGYAACVDRIARRGEGLE